MKEPVRIREKVLGDGTISLYLDMYHKGNRKKEGLKLYIIPETSPAAKLQNENTRRLAEQVRKGEIDPLDITEESISSNLYLPDVPDPELIIRPSGEMRLSNFLLWESAYSELWVSDTLWPDFGYEELTQAFRDYAGRDRRFGGLSAKDSDEGDKK